MMGGPQYSARVLKGAARIATVISHESSSVVCHCSSGWDRTSQLCALSQLLLDPHYRT